MKYRYFVYYIAYASTRRKGNIGVTLDRKIHGISDIRIIENYLENKLVASKVIIQNWKLFE